MSLPIDYRMEGIINDQEITHVGEGEADLDEGIERVTIQLSAIPDGWHPMVLPMICSGPSRVGVAQEPGVPDLLSLSGQDYFTEPGKLRLGELYNEDGEQLGKVAATGTYRAENDELKYRIRIRSDMDLMYTLDHVEHYSYTLLPNGPGRALVYSHFRIRDVMDNLLLGYTSIPYGFGTDSEVERPVAGIQFFETDLQDHSFTYRSRTQRRFVPTEDEEYHNYFSVVGHPEELSE